VNASVGEQLRQAREQRSLSLEQVAQATHMRVHYLLALESNDLESIPSQAQARGFLRAYAAYLGLEAGPLLASMFAGEARPDKSTLPEGPQPEEKPVESGQGGSEAVFIEIGESLQRQRQMLGLSIEDVERHTHLRHHYILALEAGDLDGLPSPVQGRGMLKNYAASWAWMPTGCCCALRTASRCATQSGMLAGWIPARYPPLRMLPHPARSEG